jgi:hypothetical protein
VRTGASLLVALVSLLGLLAAVTWWALEWSEVAVLETRTADGGLRSTHVWYAEPDGELWLEAGTRENGWFLDIERQPELGFTGGRRSGRYRARIVDGAPGHAKIRALLRQKYGLRDAWVGLIVDTSGSVAVRLDPWEQPER